MDAFIGRTRELAELESALAEAVSGMGRLVMLAGEPGIGKTRLAEELSARAADGGARTLWGRCYEREGAPPYWPWVQIIQTYVRNEDADQLKSVLGSGAPQVAELVPEIRELFPDVEKPA